MLYCFVPVELDTFDQGSFQQDLEKSPSEPANHSYVEFAAHFITWEAR